MLPIRTILHPTDFSEPAGYAFRLALSLARDQGARLIVLHVMPVPLVQEKRGYREEMAEDLSRIGSPDPRVGVEHRLEEGDPAIQILQVARETGCDLIVMGTHGRTGLGRLLMGSVAEQVTHRAPCPVLTVKAPFPPSPPAGAPVVQEAERTVEATKT
ncbi:MAG: universal stress protein [Gemmataceae bacterium]|nr:universal stress protein [Gemmataceae bacterium]